MFNGFGFETLQHDEASKFHKRVRLFHSVIYLQLIVFAASLSKFREEMKRTNTKTAVESLVASQKKSLIIFIHTSHYFHLVHVVKGLFS